MSEHQTMPENPATTEAAPPPSPRRGNRLRRLGCYILVILWFLFLLTPCLLFNIASTGQIVITLGDAPDQVLRLWVVEEIRERGIAISRPTLFPGRDNTTLCVQTDVTFLLWAGSAEPVSYCSCYARASLNAGWSLHSASEGRCPP